MMQKVVIHTKGDVFVPHCLKLPNGCGDFL